MKNNEKPFYEVTVDSTTLQQIDGDHDGLRFELNNNLDRQLLCLDYGERGDEPFMPPTEAKEDYMSKMSITTFDLEADEQGEPDTNKWTGTINFPVGRWGHGGEFLHESFRIQA